MNRPQAFDHSNVNTNFLRGLLLFIMTAINFYGAFYLVSVEVLNLKINSSIWWWWMQIFSVAFVVYLLLVFIRRIRAGTGAGLFILVVTLTTTAVVTGIIHKPLEPEHLKNHLGAKPAFDPDVKSMGDVGETISAQFQSATEKGEEVIPFREYLPHVMNQGTCDSCWATTAAYVISARYNITHGIKTKDFEPADECPPESCRRNISTTCPVTSPNGQLKGWSCSPEVIIQADKMSATGSGKCHSNTQIKGFELVQQMGEKGGLDWQCYPYMSGMYDDCGTCVFNSGFSHSLLDSSRCYLKSSRVVDSCINEKNDPQHRPAVSDYFKVESEEKMFKQVRDNGPVLVFIRFYTEGSPDWTLQDPLPPYFGRYHTERTKRHVARPMYDGNRYSKQMSFSPRTSPFHALVLIGYGTTENGVKYWVAANSWGQDWGDNGLIRIERGVNAWQIADYGAFPEVY